MPTAKKLGPAALALAIAACGNDPAGNQTSVNYIDDTVPMVDEASNAAAMDARPDPGDWKEPSNKQGDDKGPP